MSPRCCDLRRRNGFRIRYRFHTLLVVLLSGLVLTAAAGAAGQALPVEVAEALEQADCAGLMRLNHHYWRLAGEDNAPPEHRRAAKAVEARILSLPLCGDVEGELIQVQPHRGVNFFDYRDPVGRRARTR